MASAKKLPSGSWRALAYVGTVNGKRKYKSFTALSKKEAEYAAAEYLVSHKKDNQAENLSFKDASDVYLCSKSNLLSPSTIRGYRIMQRNAFTLLSACSLRDLSETDIIQKQMNDNAAKYSAKSIKNQYGFVSAVLRYHKVSIDKVTLKPKENKKLLVPTRQDAEKIMQILSASPRIECPALLALTCSLRQSEIAAICVEDVDGNKIRIHNAMVPDENNQLVLKETNKSYAGTRTIVVPMFLSEKIKARCEEVKAGRLFSITPNGILKTFKRLLTRNGIPPYTIHSLRHCFAAIMHAQNVPDKYVMEMGGWTTDNVLKNVYQYTFEDEVNAAKVRANTYFDDVMQHEMQHDE